MLTARSVREKVQAVVEAHLTHNHWYSSWSDAKDRPSQFDYPAVVWDQWTSRHPEDLQGFLSFRQLVRLWVFDRTLNDRTPAERDTVIEDAHAAALDFVLRLRLDGDLELFDVQITTVFDEQAALESGVILTFVVAGTVGLCYDATHFIADE